MFDGTFNYFFSTRHYWLISIGLLFFSLSILTNNAQADETPNPYGLITEQNFSALSKNIADFWQTGQRGTFTGVDGIKISYISFKTPNEKGAIVIVNGRTESYIKYQQLAYELSKTGYSIYLYDHRGQGLSQRLLSNRLKGYVKNFNDYVHDLKTFYTLKISAKKHDNLFMLGHSMGGTISVLYAKKYPADFQAIALSSPMLGLPLQTLICPLSNVFVWAEKTFSQQIHFAPGQNHEYDPPKFSENNPDALTHIKQRYVHYRTLYEQFPQVKLGGVTSVWLAQACRAIQQISSSLNTLNTPFLVIQSGADDVVANSEQDDFCAPPNSTEKSLCEFGKPQTIDNAYHEILFEADIYRIPAVNLMLDFFKRRTKTQPK